jgi:glycolate oxidase FAD binding subunit
LRRLDALGAAAGRHRVSAPADIVARFADLLGADAVESGPGTRAFRADTLAPRCVLFPTTVEDLRRCAAAATEAGLAVIPAGNGTHLGVGRVPTRYDIALSTRRMRRIIAHAAADMTVTVEAGLTLEALNAALATARQWLPLDPPHPEVATVGALIAADAAGSMRASQGKVRDLLIGITAVLADGTSVRGGGRVVKNVAGYDLMKLLTGSFGTLAVIVEATFKIRPRPEHEAVWIAPADDSRAAVARALHVLDGPVAPLFVDVVNRVAAASAGLEPHATVVVGLAGTPEEIDAQAQALRALGVLTPLPAVTPDDVRRARAALRDFAADIGRFGCKVSVLPSHLGDLLAAVETEATRRGLDIAALAHVSAGVALLRFPGELLGDDAMASFAEWVRATARALRGWTIFDPLPVGLKARVDPWGDDLGGLALMRRIKQALDPHGVLSPGRFVGGI